MASSRLEKIGNIYSRITGLLRSGAMKIDDKPIWYDVYEAFPPKLEPKFDRPAPNINVRPLFYEEDIVRAKYHKHNTSLNAYNLLDSRSQTQTQIFIDLYNKYKGEGALSEDKIFETAEEMLHEKMQTMRNEREVQRQTMEPMDPGLVSSFTDAKNSTSSVNIKDIFKD